MPAAKDLVSNFAPAAFLIGLMHVGWLAGVYWAAPSSDFQFIWQAGEFWAAGKNPYTDGYALAAAAHFPALEKAAFLSGPNWFPLAAFFALFDPLTASRLWFGLNAALLLGASALNVFAFRRLGGQSVLFAETEICAFLKSLSPATLFFLHAGFILTAGAAGPALSLGASSAIVYFGASLLLFGVVTKHDLAGAGGLALILLEPVFGLLFAAALALSAFGRRVLVLGGLISFLTTVPALIVTPGADIAEALIAGTREHPEQLTVMAAGLRRLFMATDGPDLGAAFYLLLALAAVSAACLAGRKRARPLKPADNLMIAAAGALLLAPLHLADVTLLGVVVLYAAGLRAPVGALALSACLLIWRAGDLPAAGAADGGVYAFIGALALAGSLALSAAYPSEKLRSSAAPARKPRLPANVILFRTGRDSSSPSSV